jgi:hypothetical protein
LIQGEHSVSSKAGAYLDKSFQRCTILALLQSDGVVQGERESNNSTGGGGHHGDKGHRAGAPTLYLCIISSYLLWRKRALTVCLSALNPHSPFSDCIVSTFWNPSRASCSFPSWRLPAMRVHCVRSLAALAAAVLPIAL